MHAPTVLCITDFWYPKLGGMERSLDNLARTLPSEFGVQVLTRRVDAGSPGSLAITERRRSDGPPEAEVPEAPAECQRNDCPFRVVACPADGAASYYPEALDWITAAPQPRVVHVFGFSYFWPTAQARFLRHAAHLPRTALVLKVPTLGDARRSLRTTHSAAAACVDRFVALTDALAEELRLCGVDSERIVRVPNGVRTDYFRPPDGRQRQEAKRQWGLPRDRPVLGFCGRFENRKRIDLLAAALRRIDPAVRPYLVLVGATDHTFGTGYEINGLLDDFISSIPEQRDMRPIFCALDAYVTASEAEGMSNSVLEAMASGLPVVASDIPGHRELVRAAENGLIFPCGNAGALADTLREVAAAWRRGHLSHWGERSRLRAVGEFDQQIVTRRYTELYLELAARANRSVAPEVADPMAPRRIAP